MIQPNLTETIVRGARIAFDLYSQTSGTFADWLATAREDRLIANEWYLGGLEPRAGLVWSLHRLLERALNSADHPFPNLEPVDQDALMTAMRAVSGIIELDLTGMHRCEPAMAA